MLGVLAVIDDVFGISPEIIDERWSAENIVLLGKELGIFVGHVIGTCAVLYVLFLCRLLGAGDIKLMAVCVGILGVDIGAGMILCGFVVALIVESLRARVWLCGYQALKGMQVRLAPYLLLGYGLFVLKGEV